MSPGPYLTVTVVRTLQKGPLSASLMLAGHALLEATLLIGFAFGLHRVLQLPTVELVLAVVGGVVLLWMGMALLVGTVGRAWEPEAQGAQGMSVSTRPLGAVTQGALVSLGNPYWALWWATIGVKLAADGLALGPIGVLAFFIGHQLADVAWYELVIFGVHRGRRMLTARAYGLIMRLLGVALLYIGVRFVGQGCGLRLPWLPF
jgi:threonine/homoserine/homoserine lactone efflux protein